MGRKWIPKRKWERSPHADWSAPSLWWCRSEQRIRKIVKRYLKQVSRGTTPPENFKEDLLGWLDELRMPVQVSPRRTKYWTIPGYALAHNLNRQTFCKRLREMEKIAAKLFPDDVPPGNVVQKVTNKQKRAIVARYYEVARDVTEKPGQFGHIASTLKVRGDASYIHAITIRVLAEEFHQPISRIGQICRPDRIGRDGIFRFPRK